MSAEQNYRSNNKSHEYNKKEINEEGLSSGTTEHFILSLMKSGEILLGAGKTLY